MNIASLILAAAAAVAPSAPQPEGEPSPTHSIVAEASVPPWMPSILLLSAPCKTKSDGRAVVAKHSAEGVISGCWVRAMGSVFIVWDDGDGSIFEATVFEWKLAI